MTVSTIPVDQRLTVVKGLARALRALERRNMRWLARCYAAWHLRWVRRRFRRVIFWYSEHSDGFHRFMPYDSLVYDCIDPCFSEDRKVQQESELTEVSVLLAADHVFATADTLLEKCKKYNPNVTLLNNGCDPAELSPRLVAEALKPIWWPEDGKPIASYFGGVNERLDLDALAFACTQNEGIRFIIAGPVQDTLLSRLAVISQSGNVTCTGPISVEDMRYLLANSSVMLIPFKMNPIGDAINPQKMYAYSLLGKPIISLATRELIKWSDVIIITNSSEEFSGAIYSSANNVQLPESRASLEALGLANTWDIRADEAWVIIKNF